MPRSVRIAIGGGILVFAVVFAVTVRTAASLGQPQPNDGQAIFRFDTFGDEQLWTKTLRMHEAIVSVSPATALAVGLKVDADALPPALIDALRAGQVDLTDPAVTIALLRLNAVVGVMGKFDNKGQLVSIGTTCALCHSTVDNSFTTGIGKRLDGWPNRDLNVGAILGLSPTLDNTTKAEFSKWGPGKYDPRGSDSKPTMPMARSPTGTSMSGSRKWAGRATSAIPGSVSRSNKNRISSHRSCLHCVSISWVFWHPPHRPGALMPLPQVAANVCSTAKRDAQRATCSRTTQTCSAVPIRTCRSSMTRKKSAPILCMRRGVRRGNTEPRLYVEPGSARRIFTTAARQPSSTW